MPKYSMTLNKQDLESIIEQHFRRRTVLTVISFGDSVDDINARIELFEKVKRVRRAKKTTNA